MKTDLNIESRLPYGTKKPFIVKKIYLASEDNYFIKKKKIICKYNKPGI